MPLFFIHFSTRIQSAVRKYRSCGHAVDRLVDVVESYFSSLPLFYHDYWSISGFRDHSMEDIIKKEYDSKF